MPKCRVIQALCNLAQKGLIFLINAVPGRNTLPVGAVSLGVAGGSEGAGSSYATITQNTLLMLNVAYHEAVDAFRPKKSSSLHFGTGGGGTGVSGAAVTRGTADAPVYAGRVRAPVLVSERLRKAVLEPLEPIVYQHGAAGTAEGLARSVSIAAHQALVDSLKGRTKAV